MLLSRLFDGVSDVVIGFFIEKTNSPYGKTRVWILRMIIPFFIAMAALFSVPSGLGDTGKYIYIFLSYNFAITVVYTAINLPYGAMSTMMTNDSHQRSVIVIFRILPATAGGTMMMLITYSGKGQEGQFLAGGQGSVPQLLPADADGRPAARLRRRHRGRYSHHLLLTLLPQRSGTYRPADPPWAMSARSLPW